MSLIKVNDIQTTTGTPNRGRILQVAQVVKTDAFSTDSDSMVDVTGLSVSITPSSANNKIQASGRIDNEGNGAIFINRTAPDRNTAGYDVRMASSITVMEVSG